MAANAGIVDSIFRYFRGVKIKVIDDWQERTEDAERDENPQCSIEENHMNYWWLWKHIEGEINSDQNCLAANRQPLKDISSSMKHRRHSLFASFICWKLKSSFNFFAGTSLCSDLVSLIISSKTRFFFCYSNPLKLKSLQQMPLAFPTPPAQPVFTQQLFCC